VTGDNTITYHDTEYIDYEGNNEYLSNTHDMLDSLPGDWEKASWWAGGVISDLGDDGKCLAQNAIGECGVALWDGDALSNSYSDGKVIIITDINYASQSSYYTNDNKELMNALIADVITSTLNTRSATLSGITSTQQTLVTNIAITQDGEDNLVAGSDLTSAGEITGDNNELAITQTGNNNIVGIDVDGNSNDIDITQNLNQSALIDITGASNTLNLNQTHLSNTGEHFAKIIIVGSSNVMDLDQTETGDKILFLDVDGSNNVTVDHNFKW